MKRKIFALAMLFVATAAAEVHSMTLRQAVDRALAQNPDIVVARLEEQSAGLQVRVARDPFFPKTYAGSGLAQTWGFPTTLDSEAPSIAQVRISSTLFNRPQMHRLSQVKQDAEAARLATATTREEIAMRAVEFYLDAEWAAQTLKMTRGQAEGLEKVVEAMQSRVEEGRDLPITVTRAEVDVAHARQRVENHEADLELAESRLAVVLGFDPGDRVQAAEEQRSPAALPDSPDAAVAAALSDNSEIRRLEVSLKASGFSIRAEQAERLPQVNLVAKYNLLARFNNFEEFFQRFQRHNGQIGISIEVPLYRSPGSKARLGQAEIEAERLRAELTSKRGAIALDARQAYLEVRKARSASEVARAELDLAREELSVQLAQLDEGRVPMQDVEAARFAENERWIAFYDARHQLELAEYRLLDRTGGLLAAVTAAVNPGGE